MRSRDQAASLSLGTGLQCCVTAPSFSMGVGDTNSDPRAQAFSGIIFTLIYFKQDFNPSVILGVLTCPKPGIEKKKEGARVVIIMVVFCSCLLEYSEAIKWSKRHLQFI